LIPNPRVEAATFVGDRSDSKGRIGYTTLGALPMVPSMGAHRRVTYRNVYMTNPWFYAGINRLAQALGRMPIVVYQNDEEGFPVRVRSDISSPGAPTSGQRLDALLQSGYQGNQPGQQMSRKAMITGTLIDRLVYGNALWIIRRDAMGQPVGLRRIRWRDVYRVEPDKDGWPVSYWWRPWNGLYYGPMQITPVSDCIHFGFGSDPEGIYGISPLEAARHSIALYDACERYLKAYLGNQARPSGFISLDVNLDKNRAEAIRTFINDTYASPENAGKVVAAAGATWQPTGNAPSQAAIVELVKLSREEAVTVLSLSPTDVGILDNAIKSNVKELREQFGRDSLGPWASDFEGEFAAQLLPQQPGWKGLSVRFDLSSILLPDLEALALVLDKLGPYVTTDEARTKFLGLSPLRFKGRSDTPWTAPRTLPMSDFPTQLTAATALKEAGVAADAPAANEPMDGDENPDGSEPQPEPPTKTAPEEA
jgi:HK97 family phage portal protein